MQRLEKKNHRELRTKIGLNELVEHELLFFYVKKSVCCYHFPCIYNIYYNNYIRVLVIEIIICFVGRK